MTKGKRLHKASEKTKGLFALQVKQVFRGAIAKGNITSAALKSLGDFRADRILYTSDTEDSSFGKPQT